MNHFENYIITYFESITYYRYIRTLSSNNNFLNIFVPQIFDIYLAHLPVHMKCLAQNIKGQVYTFW